MNQDSKKIIIMGAGPAGLAAGLELAKNRQSVLIAEADNQFSSGWGLGCGD